nr:hypothetical protein [uncultured Psychroserpens sp.]
MKTMKKMLVLVIMLTIATGYANEINRNVSSKAIAVLKFINAKKGHQYIIKDSQGLILYTETIKRNGSFSKRFNFTDLDDGFYTFEINKGFEIIIKPFQIESQTVSFIENMVTKEFKPVVRLEGDKLMISQLSPDLKSLKIELFYDGKCIHSEELKGSQVLERTYKLSKEVKGDYYVSLKSDDRCFSKTFKL